MKCSYCLCVVFILQFTVVYQFCKTQHKQSIALKSCTSCMARDMYLYNIYKKYLIYTKRVVRLINNSSNNVLY